jgi:hypothetical protein
MKAAEVLGFQLRSLLTPKSGSVLGAQLDVNYCTAMFLMHNDQLVLVRRILRAEKSRKRKIISQSIFFPRPTR